MRFLRVILSGLAVVAALVAGLFVTLFVAVTGLVIFVVRRLFGRPTPPPPSAPLPAQPANSGEVIDVVATEVRR